jgi:trehalose synthase-fused probable maltokinase
VILDTQSLLSDLPSRRWFGAKGRDLASVEVRDRTVVDDGPPALVVALVDVHYAGGGSDLYHLPLLVSEDGSARDAFDDVERLRVFGELMAHGVTLKGELGAFHFGGPGLDPMAPPGSGSIRAVKAEQSNTSVIFDDELILKVFRRVESGPNPDLELNSALTNEGFPHIPPQVGEAIYETTIEGEETTIDLGIAQRFVGDSEEGWTKVTRELHRFYDEIDEADAKEDIRFLTEQRLGDLLELLDQLGDVTAAFHVSLARDSLDAGIAPEPVAEADLTGWAEATRAWMDRLLAEGVTEIADLRSEIESRVEALAELPAEGNKTRVHGDYHLGQVLLGPQGWLMIDLEGEPARSLEFRRSKQSPLKDVAGMLRSFSYAALATLFDRGEPDSPEWERLLPWATTWERLARDRYLTAYLGKAHEGRYLPADRDRVMVLLDVFEIDKALYELHYERNHRPDWIRIPLRGIVDVIERGNQR